MRDKLEIEAEYVQAKLRSYARSLTRLQDVESAVASFSGHPDFYIIRMYYFGETYDGLSRGGAKPYTFEEIRDELADQGVNRSVKSIRAARTKLVQGITVQLFGVDGAVSIANGRPRARRDEGQ